jgi:hypothetical protein
MAEPSDKTKKSVGRMSLGGIGKSLLGGAKKFAMWNLRHNTGNLFNKTSTSELVDKNHMPPAKVLGEIYKMMKIMDEDKKLNHEMVNSHLESEELKKDIRNKEIIKALTGRKKKKPVTPRKRKAKKEEEPTPPTGKGKEPKKGKEPDKVPNKSDDAKRNADAKKAEADRKAKEAKDAADAKKAENERAAQEREAKRNKDEQDKSAARQKELEKEKQKAKEDKDAADKKAGEAQTEAEKRAASRAQEEANRKIAEAERKAAEETKARAKSEAERKAAEEERKRLAEEEKKRLAEEERKRLAEEEKKRLAEEERKRLAEAEKKRLAEEETAKRLKDEETRQTAKRIKDEEEAARKAQEAATAEKNKLPENKPSATPSAGPAIITGVVGMTVAEQVAARISKRESAGNSPDSFLLANYVGADKNNPKKPHDIAGSNKIEKGNNDITTGKKFDKSLTDMSIGEVIELAERRAKYFGAGGAGSAMGKYQFIPITLKDRAPSALGKNWMNEPFSAANQEKMNLNLITHNAKQLQDANVPITDASLYMLHFFGNPWQAKMVLNGKDSDSMSDILDYYWNKKDTKKRAKQPPSAANPKVAALTVGEYKKQFLNQSFDYKPININDLGKQIEDKTKQIQSGKQELKEQQQSSSSGTNNVVINQQNGSPAKNTDPEDDRPGFFKKLFNY